MTSVDSLIASAIGAAVPLVYASLGELVAERSGVSAGTIKHYLREGLLGTEEDVLRTSRNMAYYPQEFVERIRLIKRLQEERFMPLRVIREVMADDPERAARLIELGREDASRWTTQSHDDGAWQQSDPDAVGDELADNPRTLCAGCAGERRKMQPEWEART